MIPAFFYFAQYIPKHLQDIINGATGGQINSLMVRSYIQDKGSIPLASERKHYKGGISLGNPGIYKDVKKVDVASLYPSIILSYGIKDIQKDPEDHFHTVVKYLTEERLKNKQLGKTDHYYSDLSAAQKILINSAYGFLGSAFSNFNCPDNADRITRLGREILTYGLNYCEKHNLKVVNADTDSFSYCGDRSISQVLKDLNRYKKGIVWEHDGEYDSVLVVKAKNYVLRSGDNIKIIGASLKASSKEKALKTFLHECILDLMDDKEDACISRYDALARTIMNLSKIDDWCSKKTVSNKVLNPTATTQRRIKEAIDRSGLDVVEGDKVFVYFENDSKLNLIENWNNKYDKKRLLKKLYNTVKCLDTVVNLEKYNKYYTIKLMKTINHVN